LGIFAMKTIHLFGALLLTACGTATLSADGGGSPKPDGGGSGLAGMVSAIQTTEVLDNGSPTFLFSSLFESQALLGTPTPQCANPIGGCCYTPWPGQPSQPQLYDAGELTLSDKGTTLATASYGPMVSGFGVRQGYPSIDIDPLSWNAGDQLMVTGVGGQVPAFSVSTKAVALPVVSPASSPFGSQLTIPRNQSFTIHFTPDANSSTFFVTLTAESLGGTGSGTTTVRGTILCSVPETQGALTIDASLLQNFQAGDQCTQCGAYRQSFTQVAAGDAQVQFVVQGWSAIGATFQ
jgi:hypothetical protein